MNNVQVMKTFYIDKQGAAHIDKPEGWSFEVEDYSLLDASMVRNWNDSSDHLLASINIDGVPSVDIIKKSAFDLFGVDDLPDDIFPRVALASDAGWGPDVVKMALDAKKHLKTSKISVSFYLSAYGDHSSQQDGLIVKKMLEKTSVEVSWTLLMPKSEINLMTPEDSDLLNKMAADCGGKPYYFICGDEKGDK